jgi:probable F420-dependent oxidoreductase
MDAGIGYFPTHDAVGPAEIARLVEARGHRWLVYAEHTHIPASRVSPWGGREGAPPLPRKYAHTYDPFVAIAASLAATTALRVGTGICLVTQRDPIITAKAVASLDHLSGGRFDFGIGAGWNREEMANHGTDPRTRMRLMRERVLAMKEIWTRHEASFHGDFVHFDRIWCDPKPVQHPHPPVLVGGNGATVLDRVLAYGDAWIPNYGESGDLLERIAELQERADDAGRDIPVVAFGVPADPAALEDLEKAGVHRAVYWLPSAQRGPIERSLERFEDALAELHGE